MIVNWIMSLTVAGNLKFTQIYCNLLCILTVANITCGAHLISPIDNWNWRFIGKPTLASAITISQSNFHNYCDETRRTESGTCVVIAMTSLDIPILPHLLLLASYCIIHLLAYYSHININTQIISQNFINPLLIIIN